MSFNLMDLINDKAQAPQSLENSDRTELIKVDIDDLIPSKDNFYLVDDNLKYSIEYMGLLQPLLVKRDGDKYRIISGHRRCLACKALVREGNEKFRLLDCILKPSEIEERLQLIMANRFRSKSDWERMTEAIETKKIAEELKEQNNLPGKTRAILKELIGVSSGQMARYENIHNNLIHTLMMQFRDGRLKISVAAELSSLSQETQEKAVEILKENGEITLENVENLKKSEDLPGQMKLEETMPLPEGAVNEDGEGQQDTESLKNTDDFEPEPEKILSLCYSCKRWEECHQKSDRTTQCNEYVNKAELEKTEEQRYNEEQDAIDRDTKKKLQERQQEEVMNNLPSDSRHKKQFRIAYTNYDDFISGRRSFDIQKGKFEVGETIDYLEFKEGRATGRVIQAVVTYILDEHSAVLDGYCIIAIRIESD